MIHDPVSTALEARARGWTPVPLRPGAKKPIRPEWPDKTYADDRELLDELAEAAAEVEGPLNVGLALGARHGGLVDVDLDHPKAARLAASLLPETAMRSGREDNPGSHYWYRVTDGYDPGIRRYALPSRQTVIEYRGSGGQTVAPGSIHPDGDVYRWEGEAWGGDAGPSEIAGETLHGYVMLIALVVTLADAWPTRGSRHDAYLALVGALLRDAGPDGTPRAHPFWETAVEAVVMMLADLTHDADGPRTRVAESVPSTRKKIATGKRTQGWPTLARLLNDASVTAAHDLVIAIENLNGAPRGDLRADQGSEVGDGTGKGANGPENGGETPEERAMRLASLPPEERDPLRERGNTWEPLDLVPYLLGDLSPIRPALLRREDGEALLYRGMVNSLYGAPGSGKTWLALQGARQEMDAGNSVLLIDFEDTAKGALRRLLALDRDPGPLREGRLAYIAPEEPIAGLQVDRYGNPASGENSATARGTLVETLRRLDPSLVIVDGVTTLYGTHGLNTIDAAHTDVVARWLRWLTDHGRRTVVLIDHTAKNAGPGAIPQGSQHKIAMVTGAALQVYAVDKPRPGRTGTARVYVGKDRHGGVLMNSTSDSPEIAAELTFASEGLDDMKLTLGVPEGKTVLVDPSAIRGKAKAPGRPSSDRIGELDQIVDLLGARLGDGTAELSKKELQVAAGLSANAVSIAIHSALSEGRIVRVGTGPFTRYRLPSESS